jgi:hypothetical protein
MTGVADFGVPARGCRLLTTINGLTGPAGADRDFSDITCGEYHTWPTSAACSLAAPPQGQKSGFGRPLTTPYVFLMSY